MAIIKLETHINATVEVCFDLSRDIDLHTRSMKNAKEKAVAGVTSGLIGLGQTVTWEARHFGVPMRMTVKITEMKFPDYFFDEMIRGPFRLLRHEHKFIKQEGKCLMIHEFEFQSPLGSLGKLVDFLFLKKYMTKLLLERNRVIKNTAEEKV